MAQTNESINMPRKTELRQKLTRKELAKMVALYSCTSPHSSKKARTMGKKKPWQKQRKERRTAASSAVRDGMSTTTNSHSGSILECVAGMKGHTTKKSSS